MESSRVFPVKFKEFYWKVIFGDVKRLRFEDRLIIISSLVVALVSLISALGNYYLRLDKSMVFLPMLLFFMSFTYFLIGRFWRLSKLLYFLVSFTVIAFLDLAWYYNYGSQGSVLDSFLIVLTLLIFVWDTRKIVFVTIFLGVNLFVLFSLEYQNPNIVGTYIDEKSRVGDFYFGLALTLVMMLFFSILIKKNYLKEYEQARTADRLKSAFLANMSHEIRTPLNAIVGFSSLLSENKYDHKTKQEFKTIIEQNSEHLLELIEGIIDISKIEVNEIDLTVSRTDLDLLFKRLKENFSKAIDSNKKDVELDYELSIKNSVIETDAFRLEQVLRNLISNGIKYTQKGKVVFGCVRNGNEYTFYVKDTGIGIKEENLDRIFNRFVKIEEETSELARGTGIGLYLSKLVVEKLGGHIWVNSQYGVGSTFYFTIHSNIFEDSNFSDVQNDS